MKRRGPGVQTNQQQQYGVFSRGAKKRKSSIGGETYAPGRKGDPQLYVVGKKTEHDFSVPKMRYGNDTKIKRRSRRANVKKIIRRATRQ